jgi:hypothetical protein
MPQIATRIVISGYDNKGKDWSMDGNDKDLGFDNNYTCDDCNDDGDDEWRRKMTMR